MDSHASMTDWDLACFEAYLDARHADDTYEFVWIHTDEDDRPIDIGPVDQWRMDWLGGAAGADDSQPTTSLDEAYRGLEFYISKLDFLEMLASWEIECYGYYAVAERSAHA